jgi:hypothetical protein
MTPTLNVLLKCFKWVAVSLAVLYASALGSTMIEPEMARFMTWLLRVIQHA